MGLKYSSDESDTNSNIYESGRKTVTTSEIEASVGGSPADGRQFVRITNVGTETVYFGPSGLTTSDMDFLKRRQSVEIAATPELQVVLKTASGSSDVIIQEIG